MAIFDAVRALYTSGLRCGLGPAAPPVSGKVRLAIISEGINTWPLYVAQGRGLFEREGLDVEVTLTGSSARQLEELTGGGFDIGFQQSDHVVRAVEGGADLFIFMALAHAPGLTLVAAPQVKSFADLKGKDIAVDGPRSGYALLLRRLLRDRGLGDDDCRFKEFGGSQERFDALQAGRATASLLNPPFDNNLIAQGFGSLGTINQLFPDYPGPIAAARRSWAAQHGPQLRAFIRAINAAHAWLREPGNREEAVRLLLSRLAVDAGSAGHAFDAIARREPPAITGDGVRRVIDVVWDAEEYAGPRAAPEKYLDLAFASQASQRR